MQSMCLVLNLQKCSLLYKITYLSLETGKESTKHNPTAREVQIPCWALCSEPCQGTLIVTPGISGTFGMEIFNLSHVQRETFSLSLLLSLQIYRSICLLDALSKCYANFLLKSAGVLKNWISSMNNKQVFGSILLASHLCHIFLLLKKEQRSKRKWTDFKTVFDPTDRHYHWLTCKYFCPYIIIITCSKPASHH